MDKLGAARLGAVYIAYGSNARREARLSIQTLRKQHPDLPVAVIGEAVKGADVTIPFEQIDDGGRWAKVNLDLLTPFDFTLYLDADTRVRGDVSAGFGLLADGWELCIAPSQMQNESAFWHVGAEERGETCDTLGYVPVQWQGGVFFFRRCASISALCGIWREEWARWKAQDQAALARALAQSPVKLWALGRDYNGGALVEHLFGKAKG